MSDWSDVITDKILIDNVDVIFWSTADIGTNGVHAFLTST